MDSKVKSQLTAFARSQLPLLVELNEGIEALEIEVVALREALKIKTEDLKQRNDVYYTQIRNVSSLTKILEVGLNPEDLECFFYPYQDDITAEAAGKVLSDIQDQRSEHDGC